MTIWMSTTALVTALQTYQLLLFFSKLYQQRVSLPLKPLMYLALDAAACFAINLLCIYVSDSHMAYSFSYTVFVQFALCVVLFGGNAFYKLFYILFSNVYFTGVLMVARFAESALLPPGALPTRFLYSLFVTVLPQCAAIIALIPLQRYMIRKDLYLSPPLFYWLFAYSMYLAVYFGTNYITDTLMRRQLVSVFSVFLQFILLMISVALYILYLAVCQSYHEKIQYTLIQKQYSMQKKHLSEVRTSNQALRELRHELRNYMFYMNYLIDQGDFEKLKQFFSEFYQKEYHNLYEVSASDSFIDALLQQKITHAQSFGIDVSTHILLGENEDRDNFDLCIVLSNLLDNAIDACKSLPDAAISIKLRRVKEYLSIVVENTADHDVLKRNPRLQTSKERRDIHGLGLGIIRQIIDRYDGSIQFESEERLFRVRLMLRIPVNPDREVSK